MRALEPGPSSSYIALQLWPGLVTPEQESKLLIEPAAGQLAHIVRCIEEKLGFTPRAVRFDDGGGDAETQQRLVHSLTDHVGWLLACGERKNLFGLANRVRLTPSLMAGCQEDLVEFLETQFHRAGCRDVLSVGSGDCFLEWCLAAGPPLTMRCVDLIVPEHARYQQHSRPNMSFISLPAQAQFPSAGSEQIPVISSVDAMFFPWLWGAPWKLYISSYIRRCKVLCFISPFDEIERPVEASVLNFIGSMEPPVQGAWRLAARRNFAKPPSWNLSVSDEVFVFVTQELS